MKRDRIDLDHNALSPPCPEAIAAARAWLDRGPHGNPSSAHREGQRARSTLEWARAAVAAGCGVDAERVVFTSGATEADRLGILGAAEAIGARGTVAWLAIDHPALVQTAEALVARGWSALPLPVDDGGRLDVLAATAALDAAAGPCVVAIAAVHHELGTIQPLAPLFAHPNVTHLHVDAAQAPGRLALAEVAASAHTLALAAQKCGGFAGTGALIVGAGVRLRATQPGRQERGLRGGTENLLGAVAFAAAMAALPARAAEHAALRARRDAIAAAIRGSCPEAVRRGPLEPAHETGHVLSVTLPDAEAEAWVAALDVEGVAVSAGAACSSGTQDPSPAITALHGAHAARHTLRLSLGPAIDDDAVAQVAAAFARVAERMRALRGFAPAAGSATLPPSARHDAGGMIER
ncbi:MAG: hypothetical protein RIT45_3256 [Pseudomonadota bacterium]